MQKIREREWYETCAERLGKEKKGEVTHSPHVSTVAWRSPEHTTAYFYGENHAIFGKGKPRVEVQTHAAGPERVDLRITPQGIHISSYAKNEEGAKPPVIGDFAGFRKALDKAEAALEIFKKHGPK